MISYYAFIDENNLVVDVITGRKYDEEFEGITNWEEYYGNIKNKRCLRTEIDGSIRKNYAGIGYIYNEELDAFIPPKVFNSYILNNETCRWSPPVEYPNDGKKYDWNEETISWIEIEEPTE
jgi:hypothetical protein